MATAVAKLKNLPISPRKVRLVANLVRGKKIADARNILEFTVKGAADPLLKLLESAVANAENAASERHERIDADEMIVAHLLVNEGRTRRKYQPAPRGRATRLRCRSSHVELWIRDKADSRANRR